MLNASIVTLNDVLRYGQKIMIAYTSIDGYEMAQVVEMHWLKKLTRIKIRKFKFMKKFPFFAFIDIECTDVVLNSGTDAFPNWIHLYAQESPRLMAKKFGIDYEDITVSRIKDDLMN